MKVSEAIGQLKAGDAVWVKGMVDLVYKGWHPGINIREVGWFCENTEISLTEPKNEKVEAHLAEHWNEDIGDVLWWNLPVEEPPYCGTPLDEDFPKYKTHFSLIDMPNEIENPKRWVVKANNFGIYFTSFRPETLSGIFGTKKCARTFTDRAKSEAVATLVEGSVEEV